VKAKRRTNFRTDKRRKHHHYQVTVFYADGERFCPHLHRQAKGRQLLRPAEEITCHSFGSRSVCILGQNSFYTDGEKPRGDTPETIARSLHES